MPALSTLNQIKALRHDFQEFKQEMRYKKWDVGTLDDRIKSLETDVSDLSREVKSLKSEFGVLNQTLFDWKSELFNKIDEGYTTRWHDQTLEHAAIQSRLEEHQENIDQIKTNLSLT